MGEKINIIYNPLRDLHLRHSGISKISISLVLASSGGEAKHGLGYVPQLRGAFGS